MTKRTITIVGLEFAVTAPYAEGQTITEAEAKALNQTRSENIRNNQAKLVKAALDAAGKNEDGEQNPLSEEAMAELTTAIAEYDAGYEFTLASVGGGRKTTDPVEKEAISIARASITAQLKSQGRAVKDVDKDALAGAIAKVAASEDVMKAAKKAVAERAKLATASLADLDL